MNHMTKNIYNAYQHLIKISFKHKVIEISVSYSQSLIHVHVCVGVNIGNFIMNEIDMLICIKSKF